MALNACIRSLTLRNFHLSTQKLEKEKFKTKKKGSRVEVIELFSKEEQWAKASYWELLSKRENSKGPCSHRAYVPVG